MPASTSDSITLKFKSPTDFAAHRDDKVPISEALTYKGYGYIKVHT